MTLNEVKIIKNAVLDATEAYVDARLSIADFAKTQIGVTQGTPTETDGKFYHTVKCNVTSGTTGVTYNNVLSVGNIPFPANSVVFLIAPNAQFSNQFILGKLDDTPCHITAGSIDIGNGNFSVDSSGIVTIKRGSINLGATTIGGVSTYNFIATDEGDVTINKGSIKLDYKTGTTSNPINDYNFIVDKNGIKLGAYSNNGVSAHYFTVDNVGNVNMKKGSINIGDNFIVDSSGVTTIKNGSINLGYNTTYNQYNFVVDSNGIKLGVTGTSSSNYNFIVTNTGKVSIKSGSINIANKFYADDSGNLYVGGTNTNANFVVDNTGKVSIKSGSINIANKFYVDADGNLSIGGTTSSANFYVQASDGSVTIKQGSINLGSSSSTTSGNAFYVSNAGYLESVSGKIGGFNINSDSLSIDDATLSKKTIGCGEAGNGIVNLVGGNNDAYIQISDSGTPTSNIDGIRIYQDGRISSTLDTGWTTKYFKNIPDQEIYADSEGYLHFSS